MKFNGFIEVWFEERGFGFIVKNDEGGQKLYFHRTNLVFGQPKQGELVQFTIGRNSKGPVATNVEVVSVEKQAELDEQHKRLERDAKTRGLISGALGGAS
jgi:cold shock CspA family protein